MTILIVFGFTQVFILLLILFCIGLCWYKAYVASKSGTKVQDGKTGKWVYSDENKPFLRQNWFYVSLIPIAFLVYAVIEMISEL